jgi:protein TonB
LEGEESQIKINVNGFVWVVRGIGMGLDEKAVEAVRQYRFKPTIENGRPVTVEMYVDVVFQIL